MKRLNSFSVVKHIDATWSVTWECPSVSRMIFMKQISTISSPQCSAQRFSTYTVIIVVLMFCSRLYLFYKGTRKDICEVFNLLKSTTRSHLQGESMSLTALFLCHTGILDKGCSEFHFLLTTFKYLSRFGWGVFSAADHKGNSVQANACSPLSLITRACCSLRRHPSASLCHTLWCQRPNWPARVALILHSEHTRWADMGGVLSYYRGPWGIL